MPRFFFDTYNGDALVKDVEGTELPYPSAARKEAHIALGQMAKDEMPDGDRRTLYVNVNDDAGVPIYTVCMAVIGRWLG